jgi:O-antigen/teichoic acid export membrane protein
VKIAGGGLVRSFAAYGLGPIIGLATAPILAQALGVEGRGQLAAILQPLTLADSIAAIGIPTAVSYFVAQGVDGRRLQRRAMSFAAATAIVTYAALLTYGALVSANLDLSFWMLASVWIFVIPGALIAIRRSVWAGNRQWLAIDIERSSFALARLVVIVGLAVAGIASVFWFALGPLIAGIAISSIVLFRAIPTTKVDSKPYPGFGVFSTFSLQAGLGAIAAVASSKLGAALMPGLTSSNQIGVYAVAATVAEIPLILGAVLSRNLVAEVSAQAEKRRILLQIVLGALAAGLLSALLAAISPWAIPTFFGVEFSASVDVVFVLLVATWLSVMTVAVGAVLTGLRMPWMVAIPQIGAIAVVIVFFTLRGAGIAALEVAWVTLLSQCTAAATAGLLLALIVVRRHRNASK